MTTHFVFSYASLVLVQKASPEAQVVADENRLVLSGDKYSTVLEHRRRQALARGVHQPMLSANPDAHRAYPDPNHDTHTAYPGGQS